MDHATLSLELADLAAPDPKPERRHRRSNDTMLALHHQLAFARTEGGLDALVLVDGSGCLVAGAGAWPTCEMLAAYAPLLAHRETVRTDAVASGLGELGEAVEVRSVSIDGCEVLLCGRGGDRDQTQAASMARAAAGCRRILGGEA